MDRQQHFFCTGGSEGIGLELARQVWCYDIGLVYLMQQKQVPPLCGIALNRHLGRALCLTWHNCRIALQNTVLVSPNKAATAGKAGAPLRRAFLSRNYVVSIVSRSRKKLDAAVEELTALSKESGRTGCVFSVVADVGDCSQVGRSCCSPSPNLCHCSLQAIMIACLGRVCHTYIEPWSSQH